MSLRDRRPGHPLDDAGDPLTLNVAGLLSEPAGAARDYDVEDVPFEPGGDLRLTRPLAGSVRLSRTNRGLVVEGRLRTALAGECARCLRPAETAVEIRLAEEVLPSIDLHSGLPVAEGDEEDPEVARLTDHHELELGPLVAQEISLREPIAPLCEPGCPGLCPTCGVRLEPGHAHADDDVDPRLEALRGFAVDEPDETG